MEKSRSIRNFNDIVKIKRPGMIDNKVILNLDEMEVLDEGYVFVSNDMWILLKSWYGADYVVCLERERDYDNDTTLKHVSKNTFDYRNQRNFQENTKPKLSRN